jgi:DNA-binding MarR family transcriptional regulator
VSLTARAQPLRERLGALADEMSLEAFAGIGDAELEVVRAALARVRENIAQREEAKQVSA